MSAVNVVLTAAVSFIVLLLGKVSLDLMSKELHGQVEQLPHRILRLAARRLPSALRTQYSEDWEAELDHILKRHDARPITRLLLGFRFATSLLRGARRLHVDHMDANAQQVAGTAPAVGAMLRAPGQNTRKATPLEQAWIERHQKRTCCDGDLLAKKGGLLSVYICTKCGISWSVRLRSVRLAAKSWRS